MLYINVGGLTDSSSRRVAAVTGDLGTATRTYTSDNNLAYAVFKTDTSGVPNSGGFTLCGSIGEFVTDLSVSLLSSFHSHSLLQL